MDEILTIGGFRDLALEIFNNLNFDSVAEGQFWLVGRSWNKNMTDEEIFRLSAIKWFTGCSSPKLKEILAPYKMKGTVFQRIVSALQYFPPLNSFRGQNLLIINSFRL